MEHLSIRLKPPYQSLRFPCICASQDQATGAVEILTPVRFSFTGEDFPPSPKERIPLSEAGPFLQSWLWFDTIRDVFSTADIIVQATDFVQVDEELGLRLDTSILHRYFWYWVAADSRASREVRVQRCNDIDARLESVAQILEHYIVFKDNPAAPDIENVSQLGTYLIDDENNVLLAVALLGEVLDLARRSIYSDLDPGPLRLWTKTLLIRRLLIQAGWCISELAAAFDLSTLSDTSVPLSLSRLDRSSLLRNHNACSIAECSHAKIDYSTYRPMHVHDDCSCPDITPPYTEQRKIDRALCKGAYPVVTYSGTDSFGSKLLVDTPTTVDDRTMYVAISHVRADRLGNMRENALPACQLEYLQKCVNSLYPENVTDVPFWIDTICVPREQPARGMAIQSMRKVYGQADKILVLDSTIRLLDAKARPEDLLLAIKFAPWSTRLWTWHESMLARQVFFQLEDGLIWGDDIERRFNSEFPHDCTAIHARDLIADRDGPNGTICEALIQAMSVAELEEDEESLGCLPTEDQLCENDDHADELAPIVHKRIPDDDGVEEYNLELDRCYELMNELAEVREELASSRQGPVTEEDIRALEEEIALRKELTEMMHEESRTLTSEILRAKRNHLGEWDHEQENPFVSSPDARSQWAEGGPPKRCNKRLLERLRRCHNGPSFRYWLRGFNPVYQECWPFYFELRNGYKRTLMNPEFGSVLDYQRLGEVISAVGWRSTSWPGDEAICLAIVLDLDVGRVQRASPLARMEVLIGMLQSVPRALLFMPLPRMSTEGLRWMPKSFLGAGLAASGPLNSRHDTEAFRTSQGLYFSAEGCFIDPSDFPAGKEPPLLVIEGHCYGVLPEGEEWPELHGRLGALIFYEKPTKTHGRHVALVSVEEESEDIMFACYERCLYMAGIGDDVSAWLLEDPEGERSTMRTCWARYTPKQQEWCIS
ncbi:uncharacterized protein PV07_11895 [Cladophialophora immunda]|uniref:Heterokaryon incompatibility domain-containing protein n=1 Tax=Cladophialophora immunda TaxID=569365 RepID=A0A0D1Z7T8_9EURO|nr:uncharacterized protein PV07_11895 [Cladophialophora immunda]KIW23716.1 hypothetical protein PV07_11895 [Cladophialophora immunda]